MFDALIKKGQLHEDSEQRRVLEILNAIYFGAPKRTSKGLYLHLVGKQIQKANKTCRTSVLLGEYYRSIQAIIQLLVGWFIYLTVQVQSLPASSGVQSSSQNDSILPRYGSVGCGKTMSMDIFFSALKSHPSLRVQRRLVSTSVSDGM